MEVIIYEIQMYDELKADIVDLPAPPPTQQQKAHNAFETTLLKNLGAC